MAKQFGAKLGISFLREENKVWSDPLFRLPVWTKLNLYVPTFHLRLSVNLANFYCGNWTKMLLRNICFQVNLMAV